ncbi:R-spondin-4 [Heteronotia binoei]|uniref:R-spondin-4 n=1 Tax=Heteronotia binoei TaxID=13085 RepID=UPI0029305D05|nr:R-spondin-4 [Heteronotia binoei]
MQPDGSRERSNPAEVKPDAFLTVFFPLLPQHFASGGTSSRSDDLMLSLPQIIPGQMQWILFLLLLFVNSMEMLTQARRKKRVSVALFENCTGCVMCSEENGCTACQQRLFLLIWRDGIRQYGACVHACPPGYFGLRGKELNRCGKCRSPSCESCFSKDFCMKCKEHFFCTKGNASARAHRRPWPSPAPGNAKKSARWVLGAFGAPAQTRVRPAAASGA